MTEGQLSIRMLHDRVLVDLDGATQVRFVDQRMFGGLSLSVGGAELPPEIAHIARDLFAPELDLDALVARVGRSRSGIKRVLLNQSIVSGIGNIYADEALWRAGVHPRRRADRLPAATVRLVLAQASAVMAESLAAGGTSFDALYVDVNGRSGYFERGLAVYGRHGRPCRRCGTPVARERFANRHSHFCPQCQPAPRATA